MLALTVIGLICGALTIIFILLEIDESLKRVDEVMASYRSETQGMRGILIPLKLPGLCVSIFGCWWPVISNTILDAGIIWVYGLGAGMVGMMIGLMCSALISAYLWSRRRKKRQNQPIPVEIAVNA
jgi:hypothetical protein